MGCWEETLCSLGQMVRENVAKEVTFQLKAE